jgi:hypothetical protein
VHFLSTHSHFLRESTEWARSANERRSTLNLFPRESIDSMRERPLIHNLFPLESIG